MERSKPVVLHVDDRLLWREYVKHLLGRDCEMISCSDIPSALTRLQHSGVDLVILDHLLPGAGPLALGADLCSHLRRMHPTLPLILYTAAWRGTDEVNRERLQEMTGATVVFKEPRDSDVDRLTAVVAALLEPKPPCEPDPEQPSAGVAEM